MTRLWLRAVLAVLASGLLVTGVGVSAAAAHPATGDWRGNDTLCQASWCVRRGNLVAFWQAIVWADNPWLEPSFIDGDFGLNTHNHTTWWQGTYGVASDGEVGPNTWGRAHTRTGSGWSQVDGNGVTWWYYAYGKYATLWLRRNASTNVWQFQHPVTKVWTSSGH